ncbi:FMN-binding protein [Mangrovimonas yunxiaonensis]|uniref:FMN-binding protein n=1 Tax=Mangrovimonas yunxiaonensis TaxID=1197477 RepID=A0A084TJ98_9FLAO|nr:FMN-binding protein [Mangrovimonas yunxiaonensis]KFB00784.1 FMN-binding protein [Mangrovimonas yunxiaonensis]GGH45733.1 hypothetical protein GCM10011364_19360 [Mangrovimonas yunxiaonensis]
MKLNVVLILTFTLTLATTFLFNGDKKKVTKEVKAAFGVETFQITPKVFPEAETNKLPATFNADTFFEIKKDEALLGYAYMSNAPSKTDTFDYLVLFDANLIIKKTKVLAYREDYGGEIGSKRWLRQFEGKTTSDKLVYKSNIVAISGATISVRSMTAAVNQLLKSLQILQSKQLL